MTTKTRPKPDVRRCDWCKAKLTMTQGLENFTLTCDGCGREICLECMNNTNYEECLCDECLKQEVS